MRLKQVLSAVAPIVLILARAPIVGSQLPDRPSIPSGADQNDWVAYYEYGISQLQSDPKTAEAAFTWASHLRPDRPEPLYARWIGYWATQGDRFADYLNDNEKVLRDPRVIAADSLRHLAVQRSPFVHQGLVMFLYNQLPGRFRDDDITRGWIAMGNAELRQALDIFGRLVARNPKRNGYLRFYRASAFVNTNRPDSAAAEIRTLLAQLREAESKTLGAGYESKELLEYALGLLAEQSRNTKEARDAFGRSAAENASFAPAHMKLGEIAVAAGDTATGLAELTLASELAANDAEVHLRFASALTRAHRTEDAIGHLRIAVKLEPIYAEPYYRLGLALETAGDRRGAAEAYAQFVAHAVRSDTHRAEAERRATELKAAP